MYGKGGQVSTGATPRRPNHSGHMRHSRHSRHTSRSAEPRHSRTQPRPHPVRYLFGIQREALVVAPVSVDMQEARPQALVPEAQLLHDPQRRGVLGPDVDLDAVELHRLEAVVGRQGNRRRRDAATCPALVDPVTDARPSRRPVPDRRHGELPRELALAPTGGIEPHEPRQHLAPLGFVRELAHHRPRREPLAARRSSGIPRTQPRRVATSHRVPRPYIPPAERDERHAAVRDRGGPAMFRRVVGARHSQAQPSSSQMSTSSPAATKSVSGPRSTKALDWVSSLTRSGAWAPTSDTMRPAAVSMASPRRRSRTPAVEVIPIAALATYVSGSTGSAPMSCRIAGFTNASNATNALTGSPGTMMTGTSSSPRRPKPCQPPGSTATSATSYGPSSWTAVATTLCGPSVRPPLTTMRSARICWSASTCRTSSALSRMTPTCHTSAPMALAAAATR